MPLSGYLSGGSSGFLSSTSTTGLPDWAKGYAQDTLAKQAALSERPYEAYNAPRIQGFTDLQQTARDQAANMTTSPELGQAAGLAGQIANRGLGALYTPGQFNAQQAYAPSLQNYQMQGPSDVYGQQAYAAQLQSAPQTAAAQMYQPSQVGFERAGAERINAPSLQNYQMQAASPVYAERVGTPTMQAATTGYSPQLQQYQMGPAERVGTQSFAQPGSAEAYMSPYMQNVVDIQKREAGRQSAIQGAQQQAQAAQAGAFGGSRDAILRAERERNLAQQMGDIQATGSQAGFQNAQQQFNAEQAARLQAQQANQQAGLTAGGQNLAAQLGVQQLGTQTGTQLALANLSNQQQAAVQNQAAQLQAQGMNSQQALQAALANQGVQQQAGLQNLSAALQTQGLQAQTGLQAQQANQQTGLQALLANQQAGMQTGQFNAQLGYNTALQNAQMQQQANLANQALAGQYGLQQGQFNQAAALQNPQLAQQAMLANQQMRYNVGQQNLAALLGTQQFGAGQNLQAQLANQQMGLNAQQLAEQSRQYGAGYGLQGLQTGLQAAGQLGSLGGQRFGQEMDINQLRSAYGAREQAMGQAGLTQAYQDWQNQRDYPQQQLSNMANMMRGIPIGSTTTTTGTMTPGSPSFGQQLGAIGSGLWGLKQFFAEGGSVDSQQNIESIVHKLSDQQLDQAEQSAKARGDVKQLEAIQLEKAARASMQRGIAAAPVDMDKMLPTTESMARGGIVAFAGGGMGPDAFGYNPSASPSSYTGYTEPELELTPEEMRESIIKQTYKRLLAKEPEYVPPTPEQSQAARDAYIERARQAAGPSQYAEERENIKRMQEANAANLKQSKGIAALQAAAAILEGPDALRGLVAGASTFGKAYGAANQAAQAEDRSLQSMRISLVEAKRKEEMGLFRDAQADRALAEKYERDAIAARQVGERARRADLTALVAATKPEKPLAEKKLPELLADAEVELARNPKNPEVQARVKALRSAVSQTRSSFSLTDIGVNRQAAEAAKVGAATAGIEARTDAAINAAVEKGKLMDPEYQQALAKGDIAGMKAATDRMYDDMAARRQRGKPDTVPAVAPAAQTGPAAVETPSPAHIAALRSNPARAAEFDAKFGKGAAARALKGQ